MQELNKVLLREARLRASEFNLMDMMKQPQCIED